MHKWTDEEINALKLHYPQKGKRWCAEYFGMTEGQIRSKAHGLGLKQDRGSGFFKDWQARAAASKVGKKRPEHSKRMAKLMADGGLHSIAGIETPEEISRRAKKWIKENGHPRGMLGKTHTPEVRDAVSKRSKAMWADENSKVNSAAHRQERSDRQSKNMRERLSQSGGGNIYSRVKSKTVDINGKVFFARSAWEANVAAYLEFLVENGEIESWEHEPETFWFEEIRRGTRSYLPDFKVTEKNGEHKYIEVKGYMDAKSKTKLKRMAKYYPHIKIEVIGAKEYKAIEKNSRLFKYWGAMDSCSSVVRRCNQDGCEERHHSKGLCRKHFYVKYKR